MMFTAVNVFYPDEEYSRFCGFIEQLKEAGLKQDDATYAAIVTWLNMYGTLTVFERIPNIENVAKNMPSREERKKLVGRIFRLLDLKAKFLSHEDITLLQSIKQAESCNIPAIETFQKYL